MEEQKQLEKDGSPQEIGSFNRFPDIIMMDGGRGQVNICLQVLSELGLDIPVCGMVKDDFTAQEVFITTMWRYLSTATAKASSSSREYRMRHTALQ